MGKKSKIELPKFKIGDEVTWTSQAGGSNVTKTGTVIRVIEKDQPASGVINVLIMSGKYISKFGYGMARDHESYVIEVKQKGKGLPQLYYPLVKLLKLTKNEAVSTVA